VNISLYKDGIFEREIEEFTPTTGEVLWNIPMDLESSDQYRIKIAYYSDPSIYFITPFFEIYESTIPEGPLRLGTLAPIIVLTGVALLVIACFINRIVRKILLKKRRNYNLL